MIEFISDLLYIIGMLILFVAYGRCFFFPMTYARNEDEYGWAVTIGFFNVILLFLFSIATLYAVSLLDIFHILQTEFVKGIWIFIVVIPIHLFSVKVEKATLDYCIKKGILMAKE